HRYADAMPYGSRPAPTSRLIVRFGLRVKWAARFATPPAGSMAQRSVPVHWLPPLPPTPSDQPVNTQSGAATAVRYRIELRGTFWSTGRFVTPNGGTVTEPAAAQPSAAPPAPPPTLFTTNLPVRRSTNAADTLRPVVMTTSQVGDKPVHAPPH